VTARGEPTDLKAGVRKLLKILNGDNDETNKKRKNINRIFVQNSENLKRKSGRRREKK